MSAATEGPFSGFTDEELRAKRPLMQQILGIELRADLSTAEAVVVDGVITPEVMGPAGTYQGGAMATLIDTAGASCAAWHGGRRLVATQDMTVTYLAPGKVGPMRATATLLRAGSSAIVVEVRVADVGREGRLCAVGLVTCVVIGALPG